MGSTEVAFSSPQAQIPGARGRLLVWVGENAHAEALVRHAGQWAAATATPWTVVRVETPGTAMAPASRRSQAVRALRLAENLGADTDTVGAENVLSAVVDRVRRDGVTTVMIGGHPPDGWLDEGRRHWLGGLADALGESLPDVVIHVVQYPGATAAIDESQRAPRRLQLPWPAVTLALGSVVLCTLLGMVLEPYVDVATVDMLYLAAVVFVALRAGPSAAVLAVLAGIFCFDLVFVPPRWSLKPTDAQFYFAFLVMLVVGMLISRLVAHARLQARLAEDRARRAQSLNELARHLVAARTGQDIAVGVAAAVRSTFGVTATLLLPDELGALHECVGDGARCEPPLSAPSLAEAQRLFDEPQDRAAEVESAEARTLNLPLRGAAGTLGVMVVRPTRDETNSPEDRRLLGSFADQAALAIERSLFERRSASAVVEAESERLRSTLLSGISHDFRTPLTTIIGSVSSLLEQRDGLDPERVERLLGGVLGEARRMHAAMSDLLDLTRMEEGAVTPQCEWCPADELVGEVLDAMAPRLQGREVRRCVADGAIVWCDPRLLVQALSNLVDNTTRHTPPRCAIEVRVEIAGDGWRLVVRDEGPGLPEGSEADIFRKFHRHHREPAGTGTGLGLAICATVARLHGGRIEARNADGACFTMTLPQPALSSVAVGEARG